MKVAMSRNPCPKHQTPSRLTQAAPVSTTWYTVLDTVYNCKLYGVSFVVATTGEDLEVRITIDGVTRVASVAALADTTYYVHRGGSFGASATLLYASTTTEIEYRAFLLEGRSIKVEIRKTSAAGAGTITAQAEYAQWI